MQEKSKQKFDLFPIWCEIMLEFLYPNGVHKIISIVMKIVRVQTRDRNKNHRNKL